MIAFSDIDGTLLNSEREPSELLKQEVRRITALGVPFILISSRMPAAMTHLQRDLGIEGLPLICYNGGLVLVDGQAIHSCAIPVELVAEIHALNADNALHLSLYHQDDWFVESLDYWAKREENNTKVSPQVKPIGEVIADWTTTQTGAHKVMCMGEKEALDQLVVALTARFSDRLHLYRSKDTYLEIADKRISKLTGIQTLLAHHYPTLTLADCLAFGDNYNDIEMLEAVGKGVAVANAKPEVLAVADAVTTSNYEDGVARGLALFV